MYTNPNIRYAAETMIFALNLMRLKNYRCIPQSVQRMSGSVYGSDRSRKRRTCPTSVVAFFTPSERRQTSDT